MYFDSLSILHNKDKPINKLRQYRKYNYLEYKLWNQTIRIIIINKWY